MTPIGHRVHEGKFTIASGNHSRIHYHPRLSYYLSTVMFYVDDLISRPLSHTLVLIIPSLLH